ncbi:MAG: hypothetical protein QM764_11980 [Chitinophagaceae bacterium]
MRESAFPIHRIGSLICKFLIQSLSPEETEELQNWLIQNEANRALFAELTDPENINSIIGSSLN